jgi:hypothetical protein
MNFVLVYLGNKVPNFVYHNLKYLSKAFPKTDVYIILDKISAANFRAPAKVKVWLFEEHINSNINSLRFLNHDLQFRNGFWSLTIKRLLALVQLIEDMKLSNVLHVEADVWLSQSFPLEKIIESNFGIGYPLSNLEEGVASTLFIRDLECGEYLRTYIAREIQKNPNSTDCTILGSLYKEDAAEITVGILPTIIPSTSNLNENFDPIGHQVMSEGSEFFGGLFDAATWGQYLLGIDARNNFGFKHIYGVQPHHPCNPQSTTIWFDEITQAPIAKIGKVQLPLFSLHIHSKSKRAFIYPSMNSEVSKRANFAPKKPRQELLIQLFLVGFVKRVIFFVIRKVRKFSK